jgi:AdoMet-dependent heme synthase
MLHPGNFAISPFLVVWETTQACDLACRHCRASAQPARDPQELTTAEGRELIRQVAKMGTGILVLSGGDPSNRPDLIDLIRYGKDQGLRMATIPAAASSLTRDLVRDLKAAGLDQMALSLDFPRPSLHDAFRGVTGAFDKTMKAVAWAHEERLPLQINTTICGDTAPHLEEMADFVQELGIVFWEVFFLVPMGRGSVLKGLSASECDRLFEAIDRVQPCQDGVRMPAHLTRSEGPGHTVGLAPRSHRGQIFPSGFLPITVGSVRETSLADAYRSSGLFRALRMPTLLKGRCGRCEFREICGGSRSRAFSITGDFLETDPWCSYVPRHPDRNRPRLE